MKKLLLTILIADFSLSVQEDRRRSINTVLNREILLRGSSASSFSPAGTI
jgi:hypothetical protein